jgi:N-acetyl-anhydromuramyl-L-alanine amidase AmpD
MADILDKITQIDFPTDQYIDQNSDKAMIFLHHTASSGNPYAVAEYWETNADKVGTAFLIARGKGTHTKGKVWKDGQIFQCFSSRKSAWHLGVSAKDLARGKPGNQSSSFLNLNTVGIEILNWGGLTLKDGKYFTYAGSTVPADQVQEYSEGFRGYHFYQKYTPAQLDSVKQLCQYLCDRYNIPKTFKGMEIFDIDKRALRGERGIFTHCSVRPPSEKQDCHPQPELIEVLKSL